MKKLLMTLAVIATAASTVYAQGRVNFNNTGGASTNTPIVVGVANQGADGGVAGTGVTTAYSVQLLWAPVGSYGTEAAFLAAVVGSTGGFSAGNAGAGRFIAGAQPNPVGTSMPAGQYTMQARAWFNNGQFATFDAAAAAGKNTGYSPLFLQDAPASPTPTPTTFGVQGFEVTVVPEPSTLALAGLGAAALLMFRRKNA